MFEFLKRKNEFKPTRISDKDKDIDWVRQKTPLVRKLPERKKGGDRKWVLGIFLATIIFSLLSLVTGNKSFNFGNFLGKFSLKSSSSQISPTPTPTPTIPPKKTEEIVKKISNITADLQGTYGVYVFNLSTKHSYGVNTQEVFTAASLIKLPVFYSVYKEIEANKFSLETKYVLTQKDKLGGAGSMQYKPAGTIYTYEQMLELMGQLSDNTAFNVFRNIVGDEKIQENIDNLGMKNTSLKENESTPEDMGLFFRKLYANSIISVEHRDQTLKFLTKTAYEDRIPAGVPTNIIVAHKIGNEIGVFSDAGIIFGPRPFILVIMSKDALEKEAKTALPEITQTVWAFETEN